MEWSDAIAETASEFLNGETQYEPSSLTDAYAFAEAESRRFESYLRGYIIERIEAGDYVKG